MCRITYRHLLLVVTLSAACDSAPNAVIDTEPQIIGVVKEMRHAPLAVTPIVADLVIPDLPPPDDSTLADVLWLDVTADTRILVEQGDGSMRNGSAEDVTVGSFIRAWHDEWIRASLPPQYTATTVEVMRAGPGP